jgi:hypothetical protein
VPSLQFDGDVIDGEFVASEGQAVLEIEVREVRKLAGELAAQARVGKHFSVTIPFAAFHEGRDE